MPATEIYNLLRAVQMARLDLKSIVTSHIPGSKGGYSILGNIHSVSPPAAVGASLAMSLRPTPTEATAATAADSLAAAVTVQRRQLRRPVRSPPRLLRQLWLTRRAREHNMSSGDCDCNGSDEASDAHHNDNKATSRASE